MLKTCPRCQEVKEANLFPKDKARQDGFYYLCKDCINKQHREKRQSPDYHGAEIIIRRTRYKERMNETGYREKRNQYQKEYRKRVHSSYHPSIRRAHKVVEAAIMRGALPPIKTQYCKCGEQAEHYHHHNGYDQDHLLDVIPLCASCHGKTWRTCNQ